MTTTPKTAQAGLPERIYLQVANEDGERHSHIDDSTWCCDQINTTDAEYILAAQAAQPAAPTGDVHSCSLFCDNPACIKQQRDEMRERKALSDAELAQIMERVNFTYNPTLFARAVEAAHGIHPAGKEAG